MSSGVASGFRRVWSKYFAMFSIYITPVFFFYIITQKDNLRRGSSQVRKAVDLVVDCSVRRAISGALRKRRHFLLKSTHSGKVYTKSGEKALEKYTLRLWPLCSRSSKVFGWLL